MGKIEKETQQYGTVSLAPAFVDFIRRVDPEADSELLDVVDAVACAAEAGNVCFPLPKKNMDCAGKISACPNNTFHNINLSSKEFIADSDDVMEKLLASKVVGRPGEMKPLILDQKHRLYLYRYWKYEQVLAEHILSKAREEIVCTDTGRLRSYLNNLFSPSEGGGVDWQKVACITAFHKKFCVICGGPGTGKTSTVVKIMALLVQMEDNEKLKFGIAAPTGKAASRLQDSIKKAKGFLNVSDAVIEAIPDEVQTIHRILGYRHNSPYFRHNSKNHLDIDVLVVDEASMIDLALMAKLLDALPDKCRVLFLGDRDQLSSVEAGRVLGDICRKNSNVFSESFAFQLKNLGMELGNEIISDSSSYLDDCIVILEKSYRFHAESGIGKLARAINSGHYIDVLDCLGNSQLPDISQQTLGRDVPEFQELINSVCSEFFHYLKCTEPKKSLELFEKFRLLCVHRRGRFGAERLNSLIEDQLAQNGFISRRTLWYPGRPVLITQNDYNLGLFNGDTGVTLRDRDGQLRVFFFGQQGEMRSFSPLRIPTHETAFAVTVHKSQGSEFDHVALLLAGEISPVLCRELLYTAVTRARKKFVLWGDTGILREGLRTTIQRNSGLADKLYGET